VTPSAASSADRFHDVLIIGAGPAGSALARACVERDLDVALIGEDAEWTATYGAWVDEVDRASILADADVTAGAPLDVCAWTDRCHELRRPYTLLDNSLLRSTLRRDVLTITQRVLRVSSQTDRHRLTLETGEELTARLVIDATGWPGAFANRTHGDDLPFWQTAFGVVLPEPPAGDLGRPTLMDFREPPRTPAAPRRGHTATTFAYSLPVADGWLVEETVLAARQAVEPVALLPLLAARLHLDPDAMLDRAVRTEYVRIPMGASRPRRDQAIVAFGAAAGYVNPTSGYSVVHSMQMAPAVAAAIADSLGSRPGTHVADSLAVWNAVWPVAQRRTRLLHDYGLVTLGKLDGAGVREFFGAFFELPLPTWSAYMRADASPTEVSRVMTQLFRAAPWSTRRRLLRGNPAAFARLARPS
jgi:lycopene beta-cyclase